ncbi:MAG: class I SAM-dependent methyltransferase [Tepidiformaceae bacterium]
MTTSAAAKPIDQRRVEEIAETAFGYLTGTVVAAMIYLGDELGLYRALHAAGPVTSAELATRTGLNERWVREWLGGQAAARLLEYREGGGFELTAEGARVLADEDNPDSLIGAFSDLPEQLSAAGRARESFRTGIGFTYDDGGPGVARSVERMLGPWNKTLLITDALPKLGGVVPKLEAGAKVADVGCGGAIADIAMARAFPNSEFHGYDDSTHALSRARANARSAGVGNVALHDVATDPLPEQPTYDLVVCLDCLHDMARPDLAAGAIRRAIKPDGVWFIVDIECSPKVEENLANPLSPLMYGYSILTCMASSASTEDGLALGTVGLPEPRMRELVTAAGFSRFERVAGLEHPFNAYYEARP